MADSSTTVYFVTGANRGIGYAVAEKLAARPNTLVYATARDPSKADKLQQLAKQHKSLRVVKLSVESDADHAAAAKLVEAEAGRVDVLLANAGIARDDAMVRTDKLLVQELRDHFEVNTVGPVRLFTAFFALLNRSFNPKFVVVSTAAGSIGIAPKLPKFPVAHYGASKAAINFIVQRIHIEHPSLTAFPLHPGLVQSEMGNAGAAVMGLKEAPITLDFSSTGIIKLLDVSTRETHSGKFWNVEDGKELPW